MKHTVAYFLCAAALVLSGAAAVAGTGADIAPTGPAIAATAGGEIAAQSNAQSSVQSNDEPGAAQKPAENKHGRPSAGDFPAMSKPDAGAGIIQVTLGLFVVLLIIAAAAWVTRRFGRFHSTAGGMLRIVGGLHLGARERLVVVQVGDQQLVLGVAPGRVSALHVLARPLDHGAGPAARKGESFRDKLNAAMKRPGE